jgi:hypothetical protein
MEKSESLCKVIGIADGTYSGRDDKDTAPNGGRATPTDKNMEMKVMLLQARMVKEE